MESGSREPEIVEAPGSLGLVMLLVLVLVMGMLWADLGPLWALTPVRLLLGLIATALGVGATLLAARGLWTGHRWALQAVQFLIGMQIIVTVFIAVGGGPFFYLLPGPFEILIGLAAAAAAPAILSERMTAWAWQSTRWSRILAGLTISAIVVGAIGPVVAQVMPDPTQVGADALTVRASAACRLGSASVTIDVLWSRTDLWPEGPFGRMSDTLTVLLDNLPPGSSRPIGTQFGDFAWKVSDSLPASSASPAVANVGPAGTDTPDTWATIGIPFELVIAHDALRAGHDYHFVGTSATNLPGLYPKRLFVEYAHGDRFSKTVEVGCGA